MNKQTIKHFVQNYFYMHHLTCNENILYYFLIRIPNLQLSIIGCRETRKKNGKKLYEKDFDINITE